MRDIYYDLAEMSVAEHAWELRDPLRYVLNTLAEICDLDISDRSYIYKVANHIVMNNEEGFPDSRYGNNVRLLIMNAIIKLRTGFRVSSVDDSMIVFYETDYGRRIKESLISIFKGLGGPSDVELYYHLSTSTGAAIIIAGNDDTMFKHNNSPGIALTGTSSGLGEYNVSTDKYEITMKVTNKLTGETYSETISRNSQLTDNDTVIFFKKDELTAFLSPGLIDVKVLTKDQNNNHGTISTDYCKFGINEPTGVISTDENDYDYYIIHNVAFDYSVIVNYKGEYTKIRLPVTLEGAPVRLIYNTAFMDKNLERVVIPEGIAKIE